MARGGDGGAVRRRALWLSFAAPPDYQQGETVKIMYLHVPAAWMATFVYAVMAAAALGTLVWRHPLADAAQKAAAPLGAGFTFICLATGSLWGKPMWGTYWVWDARLTSVLVLFILYLGLIALWRAIDDPGRAARAVAILTLVGCVNLPIIKFSVDWWNTLHQPASVFRLGGPTIAPALLWPLIVMSLAFTCLFLTLHVMAIRNEILRRRIARVTMLAAAEGDRLAPEFAAGGALMADPHIGFVIAAYAVAAATIAAMIGAVVLDGRRLNAQMDAAARALDAARGGVKDVGAPMSVDAETAPRPRRWLVYLPLAVFAALGLAPVHAAQRRRSGEHSLGADRPVRSAADPARPRRRGGPDRRRLALRPRERGQRLRLMVRALPLRA